MTDITNSSLLFDIKQLIDSAKTRVAVKVNQEMTMLYWNIGKRIQEDILKFERAEYGKKIFATVSQELINSYGKGFSASALTRMVMLYEYFPDTVRKIE